MSNCDYVVESQQEPEELTIRCSGIAFHLRSKIANEYYIYSRIPRNSGDTILNYQEIDAGQIDEMVYKLYALTPEEIAIVEGNV